MRVAYEVFSGVVTATLSVLCNQCSYVEPQVWTNPARNGLVRILTGYGGVTAATGVRNISSPFSPLFHPGCSQRKTRPFSQSLTLSLFLSVSPQTTSPQVRPIPTADKEDVLERAVVCDTFAFNDG